MAFLLAAVALLATGAMLTRKVYDKQDEFAEFGIQTFTRLGDRQFVVDATFTGVARQDGKLFSTYDRAQPRGKKACPT